MLVVKLSSFFVIILYHFPFLELIKYLYLSTHPLIWFHYPLDSSLYRPSNMLHLHHFWSLRLTKFHSQCWGFAITSLQEYLAILLFLILSNVSCFFNCFFLSFFWIFVIFFFRSFFHNLFLSYFSYLLFFHLLNLFLYFVLPLFFNSFFLLSEFFFSAYHLMDQVSLVDPEQNYRQLRPNYLSISGRCATSFSGILLVLLL